MYIQVARIKDAITGSYNGTPFGVTYNEEKYKAMKELETAANNAASVEEINSIIEQFKLLTVESYKELAETKCPYIYVNSMTNKFYLKLRDKVLKDPMPAEFAHRIIKSIDEGIDFLPMIKAYIRFMRNPNYSLKKGQLFSNYLGYTYTDQVAVQKAIDSGLSHDKAVELNTRIQTPITQEGLLVTYKVVTELKEKWALKDGVKVRIPRWEPTINEDSGVITYAEPLFAEERMYQPCMMHDGGDEFTCNDGGYDNFGHIVKVGKIHALQNWSQVNTQDGVVGSKGLHAGNLDYIRGYQQHGTATMNVFIDPMHIGRFTNEGEGAIVAKQYFVYGVLDKVNKGMYHSSAYAALGDTEYEDMLAESLKQYGELAAEVEESATDAKIISGEVISDTEAAKARKIAESKREKKS